MNGMTCRWADIDLLSLSVCAKKIEYGKTKVEHSREFRRYKANKRECIDFRTKSYPNLRKIHKTRLAIWRVLFYYIRKVGTPE